MGDFPVMTAGGTFIINGAERVIVSQIVRSPGVYFGRDLDKSMLNIYSSTVIPYHGAWLEYETDGNDMFNVRIDKNRKLPITWFLRAMGAYDESRPSTWLSCVAEKTVGAVTNERLKEIYGEDERMLATWNRPRPCWTACSMTAAAMSSPMSDVISSTRSSLSTRASWAMSWAARFPTRPPARSSPKRVRSSPARRPARSTKPAS